MSKSLLQHGNVVELCVHVVPRPLKFDPPKRPPRLLQRLRQCARQGRPYIIMQANRRGLNNLLLLDNCDKVRRIVSEACRDPSPTLAATLTGREHVDLDPACLIPALKMQKASIPLTNFQSL
jgi:hypothetical protein